MLYSPNRCTMCVKGHLKCDRRKPSCSICIKKNHFCSYEVRVPKDMKRKEYRNKVAIFSIGLNQNNTIIKDVNFLKAEANKKDQYIFSTKYISNSFSNSLTALFKPIRRSLIENLMTMLQYPSISDNNNGLRIMCRYLTKTDKNHWATFLQDISISRPNNLSLQEFLSSALKNYFIYVNSVLPLFIEEEFDFYSKPLILRLAILATGLVWMKRSQSVDYLITYFGDRIYERVKLTYRLKPSLEMVQAMLIVALGLKVYPPIGNITLSIWYFAYQFSAALGLHLYSIKSNKSREKEMAMTYSCLNTNVLVIALMTNYFVYNFEQNESTNSMLINLVNNQSKLRYNIIGENRSITLLMNSFNSDLGIILTDMKMLKEKYVLLNNATNNSLNFEQIYMLKRISKMKEKYLDLLSTVYKSDKGAPDYRNFIIFTYHYLNYYVLTLSLYHVLDRIEKNKVLLSERIDEVKKAAIECQYVVNFGVKLPFHFISTYGIPFISQCTGFLIRFQKLLDLDFSESINKTTSYFESAKSFPWLHPTVVINSIFLQVTK